MSEIEERWWHKARNTLNGFIANINDYFITKDDVHLIKAKNKAVIIVEMGKDKNKILENIIKEIIQHLENIKLIRHSKLSKALADCELYRDEIVKEYIEPNVKKKEMPLTLREKAIRICKTSLFS